MFNPHRSIGQEIDNSTLTSIFKCAFMGGMRRSNETNTLVLVADYTKGLYHDKWIGGTLHYTGMVDIPAAGNHQSGEMETSCPEYGNLLDWVIVSRSEMTVLLSPQPHCGAKQALQYRNF